MKILITGGAGFIGSFAAKALIERGNEVVLFDDLNDFLYPSSRKQARLHYLFPDKNKRPRLIVGNILDAKLLQTVFAEEDIDTVLHFAALANPARSLESAEEYAVVNVLGTVNVLEAARQFEVGRFLFAGSSSVYNDAQTPFREDMVPLRPRSPYGASKASAEMYCSMYHELHGLPVTALRFFSVYGPWGRPDMAPEIFSRKILQDEILEVSPGRSRDLTYIDDVVNAVVSACDKQFGFEVFNIGRGEPQSLDTLVAALGKAAGKEVKTKTREEMVGELAITYADISKARRLLSYDPKISIEEGAKKLIDWLKEYEH